MLLICCTLACGMIPGGAVAEPVSVIEYQESTGAVGVYISGLSGGEDYALMVLREENVYTPDNLAFLDQVKAGTDGTLKLCFVQAGLGGTQLALGGSISGKSSPYAIGRISAMDGKLMDAPGAMTAIEEEAFAGSGFQYVYLGSGVERIESKAFAGCASLKAIHIPNSVTQIADDAFEGCGSVVIICGAESAASAYAVRRNIPYILN